MKALVLYGPQNFKYEENWPQPELQPGWALVKVKFCGVCGSDLPRMMMTGSYNHPKICGHEFMGEVEEPASDKFKRGEKVAVLPLIPCKKCSSCLEHGGFHCTSYQFLGSRNNGGFAEYCLVPEENLFRLPENIDERIGAFIEPLSVALHFVRYSNFKAGETAIVFGAGNIGILAAMWLRELGAKRIVIASRSDNSLEIARRAGFTDVIKVSDPNFNDFDGFDHCFEAAGANEALVQALEKVRRKGTVTIIGRDTKDVYLSLKLFEQMMRKEVVMKGCWGYDNKHEENFIYNTLRKNSLNILPLITKEADISEGEELIKRMFNKEEHNCKVLFKF